MSAPLLDLAWRLALGAALAIFLGLAFEETYKREERTVPGASRPDHIIGVQSTPGGIRTFPTLALGGAMLYLIESHFAAAFIAGLLALALWLFGTARGGGEPTLMIPASSLIAYALGPIALTQPSWVAISVSVTAAMLLGARERLHGLIRFLPRDEVMTAAKFLILVGVILPLLPNRPLTALLPLTPYQVWLAVVAVCALSYMGYLIQKFAKFPNAALLPAILGGLYSSTATTIVLARRQRDAGGARSELAAGIVAATAIMYVRLGVVVALFNPRFALALAPALAGLFVVGAVIAGLEWRRAVRQGQGGGLDVSQTNPLQLQTAAVFAVLFVVISAVSAWAKAAFGSTGLYALAAVVGVTDIDPYVINIAQGGVAGLSLQTLAAAILIAASSNNVLKAAYTIGFGGWNIARRAAFLLLALAALGLGAAWFAAT